MRYAYINEVDVVNGYGLSCSIFFQGCSHHCDGCFNENIWTFDDGYIFDKETEDNFIESCKEHYIDTVSILGGEPFHQNNDDMLRFLIRLKKEVNKPIYLWTGYTIEQLYDNQCLQYIDVLIDGKFEKDKKDTTLYLRGSTNQRVIKKEDFHGYLNTRSNQ